MALRARTTALICLAALGGCGPQTAGQGAASSQSAVTSSKSAAVAPLAAEPAGAVYTRVGAVTPRTAKQLKDAGLTSLFSIGAETTDRGYSTYTNWRTYLGPLGFSKARVQTGWADVEKIGSVAGPNLYDFSKLDEIVDGMRADGVQPWLEFNYGNAKYPGGGRFSSDSPLPAVGAARVAWIAFVRATVARYKTRVSEWEIWNEPDSGPAGVPRIPVADFAPFAVETAKAIRAEDPNARILLGGLVSLFTTDGTKNYSAELAKYFYDNRGTISPSAVQVTYHAYSVNPDDLYNAGFDSVRGQVTRYGFTVRQGENGAPSRNQPEGALAGYPWNEGSQGKYALRRLLGDFYRSIESNLFTITNIHSASDLGTKGLLKTGAWDQNGPPTYGDQAVTGPKLAYFAMQNLSAVFDSRLERLPAADCTAPVGYTVHAYSRLDQPGNIRRNMLAVWRNTDRPGDDESFEYISVSCTNFNFPRYKTTGLVPRYVDLLTGVIFAPSGSVTISQPNANGVSIAYLRVFDSPILLADQGVVPLTPL